MSGAGENRTKPDEQLQQPSLEEKTKIMFPVQSPLDQKRQGIAIYARVGSCLKKMKFIRNVVSGGLAQAAFHVHLPPVSLWFHVVVVVFRCCCCCCATGLYASGAFKDVSV